MEATCVMQLLGPQGVCLRVCGAAGPSQGPWEPGALRAALSLGGQATGWRSPALALSFAHTELFLLEPLAVCKPPSPKPSPRTPGA